jgi:hypothetical protein
MPRTKNLPPDLTALPDWAVISDQRAAKILDLSLDTLLRLDRAGDGPPRVNLSPRRHGRTVGGLRNWIQRHLSKRPRTTNAAPDGCVCEP